MQKTLLLVDDEEVIRKSFGYDLFDAGYVVTTAESGASAIKLIQKNHYDLIITDLIMENMGGLEVLEAAKQISPGSGVLILTGFGDMNSAIEALRLGADDYLLKPCDPEELLIRIDRCLKKLAAFEKIELI